MISHSKLSLIYTKHFHFSDSHASCELHHVRYDSHWAGNVTQLATYFWAVLQTVICFYWFKYLSLNWMRKTFEERDQESIYISLHYHQWSLVEHLSQLAAAIAAAIAAILTAALTLTVNTSSSSSCWSGVGDKRALQSFTVLNSYCRSGLAFSSNSQSRDWMVTVLTAVLSLWTGWSLS